MEQVNSFGQTNQVSATNQGNKTTKKNENISIFSIVFIMISWFVTFGIMLKVAISGKFKSKQEQLVNASRHELILQLNEQFRIAKEILY